MYGKRISTGIRGLDVMLRGGLIPGRTYLVKGAPGTGKTTLAMHFAMAGIANGEDVLYVTLEEPSENLRADMAKMGFRINDSRFTLIDATPTSERYVLVEDFFESFAGSMEKMTAAIKEKLRERRYTRIVLDPITMLKLTSPQEMEYRKAFLSFVKSMAKMGATVLMTSELQKTDIEEYLVSGVIELRMFDIQGTLYRGLKILKFRGSSFDHSMRPYEITDRGIVVHHDRVISLP
ncbi:RAD55 family ATPase [Thermococcus thioreducens]|uniref:ATPase n=1 Tax=Thermococcus thioreducens TaxID=277988 RepID=A0A0Q2RGF0_9EURY|nr:ATPase domain-containing protein [Thermococcus thioreducens]ASJ12387.1 ATPase [Thermococcus thioreducens]KQH83118.1 ATPase [Thermococcus thioreducens]SEV91712.1 RecA-superfamily ATPase, KaiC/GvpD/RAD55 family [Thermococcus thioreducens]